VFVQQCGALLLPGIVALRQSARSIRFRPAAATGWHSGGGRWPSTQRLAVQLIDAAAQLSDTGR